MDKKCATCLWYDGDFCDEHETYVTENGRCYKWAIRPDNDANDEETQDDG